MKSAAAALILAAGANAVAEKEAVSANPIRKVVTMLQKIEAKVQAEAKTEEELYDKYMCYCKTGSSDLEASISSSDAKIPQVESAIASAEAEKKQLEADLQSHRSDREAAKQAMATATSLREKEAKVYASTKADLEANIAAIQKAVASLEKGMAGSFLQTGDANVLKNYFQMKADVSDVDRQDVLAFLSGSSDYAPASGEITGILKQLGDEMAKDLSSATGTENGSIKDFEGLMSAKKQEVDALTASIESKTVRSGEVAVELVQMKNDLSETEKTLVEDKAFLADLEKNCATKEAEWAQITKSRSEELVALADTIKLLNDDDALELFKKTLPSAAASFVQLKTSESELRQKAVAVLRAAQGVSKKPQLDFILLALNGKTQGFEKVTKMISSMVATLKKEQTDDDDKKEYCTLQFDATDDKKKGLERTISDEETAASDAEETISKVTEEIGSLEDAIKALDKSVVEATEQRQRENKEYTELMASNTAAVDLIGLAKNRLNKFYNPALYKPAPKRELSEEDRLVVSMGGTAPPTPAPGGIAGTGITAFVQGSADPGPAPTGPAAFAKKGEEATGVISMMDLLIKDLEKEMQVAETAEKDAQADYEHMNQDAADKRAADVATLTERQATKADTEAALQKHKDGKAAATKELMATLEVISNLHGECDWLMQYYDARKEARVGEVESLEKAKAVLAGADYSLLQTKRSLRAGFLH